MRACDQRAEELETPQYRQYRETLRSSDRRLFVYRGGVLSRGDVRQALRLRRVLK